jgi:hypothetical protein
MTPQYLIGYFALVLLLSFRLRSQVRAILVVHSDFRKFLRISPKTNRTCAAASRAGGTFQDVALFAKWLPILRITGSPTRARNPVIGAKTNIGFALTTLPAAVVGVVHDLSPELLVWLRTRFSLGTNLKRLKLIAATIPTGQFSVARNLTWEECESLMGFPEGWTVAEGDSLATP